MIIRKLFKFEGAHIVRDCSSDRCKKSLHGHSYTIEVFFTSDKLDNGGMIVDFGLFKGPIKDLIDSFDHAYSIWNRESEDFKKFIKSNSERWIEMPITPSAEGYSLMLLSYIDLIVKSTVFNNGEGFVRVSSVRVHETATGYAESFFEDLQTFGSFDPSEITFSKGIVDEWTDKEMWNKLTFGGDFVNPEVELKYSK